MNRRHFLALSFTVAAASAVLAGCGSGSRTISVPVAASGDAASELGGVAGTVFRDAVGTLHLAFEATPPAGTTPAPGVLVEVVGQSVSARTNSAGGFRLDGVRAGLGTLRLTPISGATLEIPLTALGGGAVIQVGPPPISRQQAVDAAKAAVAGADGALICVPQQPLPAGVVLLSAENAVTGATGGYVTTSAQWLVYIDREPLAQFGHSVRFVLIDAHSGAVVADQEQQFWPVINDGHFYAGAGWGSDTADVVQAGPAPSTLPALSDLARNASAITRAPRDGRTLALIVKGYPRADFKADITHLPAIFGTGGLPVATPVVLEAPNATRTDIVDAWNKLCAEATMDDVVFFFISTHGLANGYALMVTNKTAPPGTPDEDAEPTSGRNLLVEHLLPSDLVPGLTNCLACEIDLLIETCYSGFWVNQFSGPLTSSLTALCPGADLTVMTATDDTHTAIGDDSSKATGGSYYLNGFLTSYVQHAGTLGAGQSVSLFQAHSGAAASLLQSTNPKIKAQNPQFYQRPVPVGDSCGVTLTPASANTDPKTFTTVDFTVQVCGVTPPDGKYTYQFTTTGRQGKILSVTHTAAATAITSDHAVISYLADSNAVDGQTDDISVIVQTMDNPPRLLSTAKATITIAQAKNLLVNGSFENGAFVDNSGQNFDLIGPGGTDITGWTVINGNIGWGQPTNQYDLAASDGSRFLDLTGIANTPPFGGVSQTIPTKVGASYHLSFDLGVYLGTTGPFLDHEGGPVTVLASAGSVSQSFTHSPSGSGNVWGKYGFTFVATGAATTISIVGTGVPSGFIYLGLDNVSVVAT